MLVASLLPLWNHIFPSVRVLWTFTLKYEFRKLIFDVELDLNILIVVVISIMKTKGEHEVLSELLCIQGLKHNI